MKLDTIKDKYKSVVLKEILDSPIVIYNNFNIYKKNEVKKISYLTNFQTSKISSRFLNLFFKSFKKIYGTSTNFFFITKSKSLVEIFNFLNILNNQKEIFFFMIFFYSFYFPLEIIRFMLKNSYFFLGKKKLLLKTFFQIFYCLTFLNYMKLLKLANNGN